MRSIAQSGSREIAILFLRFEKSLIANAAGVNGTSVTTSTSSVSNSGYARQCDVGLVLQIGRDDQNGCR
jgi:hypothetical protein